MTIQGTLLEYLTEMRQHLGRPFNPHLPELKVSRLAGYIDGYLAARLQLGAPDQFANGFFGWLTERGDHPQEGWPAKLLRDFNGDEPAAIRRFLDLAADYARQAKNEGPE